MIHLPLLMHIPDGFLSTPVATTTWAITLLVIAVAVRQTNQTVEERTVPLMGILAAFIFAAQMMNFPVAGGTSGHFLGGALAAILVGPWAAVLIMTSVIGVQGLVFQDGGLSALGANIFNMGIASAFTGFAIYKVTSSVAGSNRSIVIGGTFVGAWCGVMLAATLTSLDLAVSGSSDWGVVFPAMLGVHALIGIGEGLISAGAVAFVLTARPDLMGETSQSTARMALAKEA